MTTVVIAGWMVAAYYGAKAGGPRKIVRAFRSPDVHIGYKLALALCALPIPGPVDEIVAAVILRRLSQEQGEL